MKRLGHEAVESCQQAPYLLLPPSLTQEVTSQVNVSCPGEVTLLPSPPHTMESIGLRESAHPLRVNHCNFIGDH